MRREDGAYVRCLKTCPEPVAAIPARREHDVEVPDRGLNLNEQPEPALANCLAPERFGELAPVFTCRIRREVVPLTLTNGAAVEMAIDIGTVTARRRTVRIAEVELEACGATAADLFEVGRLIVDRTRGRPVNRTKSGIGFALVTGPIGRPVRARPTDFSPEAPAAEVFTRLALDALNHVRGNEAAVLADLDPEGIHQMHVGIRRLRAVLLLFKTLLPNAFLDRFRNDLRRLGESLGRTRDLDVLINDLLPRAAAFDPIAGAAAHLRRQQLRRVVRIINSRSYARMILDLLQSLDGDGPIADTDPPDADAPDADRRRQPARPILRDRLCRLDRRVRRQGRGLKRMGPDQEHRFRLDVKKLRYAAAAAAPAWPDRDPEPLLAGLRQLQDQLGRKHNATVAWKTLAALRNAVPEAARRAFVDAVTELKNRDWPGTGGNRGRLRKTWKSLRKTERFWEHDAE